MPPTFLGNTCVVIENTHARYDGNTTYTAVTVTHPDVSIGGTEID